MFQACVVHLRVLRSILSQELTRLGGRIGVGFVFVLLEPIFHLSVIALYHWMIRERPIYGTSKVLFLAAGLFPVFAFIHIASHGRFAARQGSPSRSFPVEKPIDFIIVECALQFGAEAFAGILLFAGIFYFITPQALPFDWTAVISAYTAFGLLGLGMSLINVGIETFFPPWRLIFGPVIRAFAMFSGVLFVPDYYLPMPLRHVMEWDPLLHGIALFRMGFYPRYPTLLFDAHFLWACVLCFVILGMIVEAVARRSMAKVYDEVPSWFQLLGG